ncbi:MAG: hypothetical protein ABR962_07150 [Candidatus Bathyarchaeia archaeon]|jgi:hypothetical protein
MSDEIIRPKKKEEICGWFGHAGWSANPNDKDLPFAKQEECRNKDLGNQEEAAIESAYDQMYGQEAQCEASE